MPKQQQIKKTRAENREEETKMDKATENRHLGHLDGEVLNWFAKLRVKNLPVSGLMPQEKSKRIAELDQF